MGVLLDQIERAQVERGMSCCMKLFELNNSVFFKSFTAMAESLRQYEVDADKNKKGVSADSLEVWQRLLSCICSQSFFSKLSLWFY